MHLLLILESNHYYDHISWHILLHNVCHEWRWLGWHWQANPLVCTEYHNWANDEWTGSTDDASILLCPAGQVLQSLEAEPPYGILPEQHRHPCISCHILPLLLAPLHALHSRRYFRCYLNVRLVQDVMGILSGIHFRLASCQPCHWSIQLLLLLPIREERCGSQEIHSHYLAQAKEGMAQEDVYSWEPSN